MKLAMHDNVPLTTIENGYKGWRKINQYLVWAKEYPQSEPVLTVLEMTDKGVVAFEMQSNYLLHRIPAGTPMHITGLFGFWQTSDADRIWICAKDPKNSRYILVSGGNFGVNTWSVVSWFCPKCANELARFEDKNPDEQPDFWDNASTYVNEFNESLTLRTCSKCNHVHPKAYPFLHDENNLEFKERW